jgi:toxin ParE1/3/4
LNEAFDLIQSQPEAGTDRSLFAPHLRSFNLKRHIVFYRFLEGGDQLVIVRIVHQRRNLSALLYHDDLLVD